MQIHELNNFVGDLDSGTFMVVDNGADTGKTPVSAITDPLNNRIDNIIAGAAPSEQEIIDARVGADGTVYSTLGKAITGQVGRLEDELDDLDSIIYNVEETAFSQTVDTGKFGQSSPLMGTEKYGIRILIALSNLTIATEIPISQAVSITFQLRDSQNNVIKSETVAYSTSPAAVSLDWDFDNPILPGQYYFWVISSATQTMGYSSFSMRDFFEA